jgi:hypothetical protein
MVHRTLSDALGKEPLNQPLSGIPGAHSAIIHRTVRCATRLSGEPAEQRLARSERTLSRESGNKHKEESSFSIKSHRRGDKKKRVNKVVYYETDSSSPSTSSSKSSTTSKCHERKKYSKMPLRY